MSTYFKDRKFFLDMFIPNCYLTFQLSNLKQEYYSSTQTSVSEDDNIAQEERNLEMRRRKFKAKFLSNSQYWH